LRATRAETVTLNRICFKHVVENWMVGVKFYSVSNRQLGFLCDGCSSEDGAYLAKLVSGDS
jgi:hypothetical protein